MNLNKTNIFTSHRQLVHFLKNHLKVKLPVVDMPTGNTSTKSVFMRAWDYIFWRRCNRCSPKWHHSIDRSHDTHTHRHTQYSLCGQRRRSIFLLMCFMCLCVHTRCSMNLYNRLSSTSGLTEVNGWRCCSWAGDRIKLCLVRRRGRGVRRRDFIIVRLLLRNPAGWAACCFKLYSGPQCAERGLLIWGWGAGDVKCRCSTG